MVDRVDSNGSNVGLPSTDKKTVSGQTFQNCAGSKSADQRILCCSCTDGQITIVNIECASPCQYIARTVA